MVMQGEEVIMTSYQELTAGGESSLLFTGCCRAKEVTDRDLDGSTVPNLVMRRGDGTSEWDFTRILAARPPPTV